jgi:putative phosphoesterase
MRLGIVSDTHGNVENTRLAVRVLDSLGVDAVLHCGDIGSLEVVELLAGWPTHFVFGNCDTDLDNFAEGIRQLGQHCHGMFGDLAFEGLRVALLHSHDGRRFRQTIDCGEYSLVCYGHTHVAAIDRRGGTLVLNPGAMYRANPHSVAVVDLPAVEASIVPV